LALDLGEHGVWHLPEPKAAVAPFVGTGSVVMMPVVEINGRADDQYFEHVRAVHQAESPADMAAAGMALVSHLLSFNYDLDAPTLDAVGLLAAASGL
jgi:hypothetical protein